MNYEPNSDRVRVMLRLVKSNEFPKACEEDENEEFRKSVWRNVVVHLGNNNNRKRQIENKTRSEFDGF